MPTFDLSGWGDLVEQLIEQDFLLKRQIAAARRALLGSGAIWLDPAEADRRLAAIVEQRLGVERTAFLLFRAEVQILCLRAALARGGSDGESLGVGEIDDDDTI